MALYTVTQHYRSGLGAFAAGDQVELADDLAGHINRDSPGTLELASGDVERQRDTPPHDRMAKGARRRDRAGDPSDEGAITADDFRAVKGAE